MLVHPFILEPNVYTAYFPPLPPVLLLVLLLLLTLLPLLQFKAGPYFGAKAVTLGGAVYCKDRSRSLTLYIKTGTFYDAGGCQILQDIDST